MRGRRSPPRWPPPALSPAGADRHRQLVAGAWLGGLVVVALGLWSIALLGAGAGGTTSEPARTGDVAGEARPPETEEAGEPEAGTGAIHGAPDERGDDANEEELTSITLDGQCTVAVSVEDREETTPRRAWEHEACVYAPIEIEEDGEEWIVVRASLNAADFDGLDARQRAVELAAEGVLWSSHYPSLNPGLWVVFDGPFPDRETARDAAEATDGEGYARALNTEADDRFCNADDGCTGERSGR